MVTVYFATNRAPLHARNRDLFSGDSVPGNPQHLTLGIAGIDLTAETAGLAKNRLADGKAVEGVTVFEQSENDQHGRSPGSAELALALTGVIKEGRELLIYVHGYDTNFCEAVWYGGQIKLQYNRLLRKARHSIKGLGGLIGPEIEILVFSWPSAGNALAYPLDFNRIVRKGWHLGLTRLLMEIPYWVGQHNVSIQPMSKLAELRPHDLIAVLERGDMRVPGRLHLLAQSMGASILGLGFEAYLARLSAARLAPLFQSVLLTCADVDTDAFDKGGQFHRLPQVADRIAVYHNQRDMLAFFSTIIWGKRRMSRYGLENSSTVPRTIEIDVTDAVDGVKDKNSGEDPDPLGHYYARMNERVIADILHHLADVPARYIPGRRSNGFRNAFTLE